MSPPIPVFSDATFHQTLAACSTVEPVVQRVLASVLSRAARLQSIQGGAARLLSSPVACVRDTAGRFLSVTPDVREQSVLRAALASPDAYVREDAVCELGKRQAINAVPEIVRALEDDAEHVRAAAWLALWRISENLALHSAPWTASDPATED